LLKNLENEQEMRKTILEVDAKRSINANPEKRGFLKELLITNQINKFEQFEFKHYGYASKASSK
jgi:hypothetical protein